MRSRLLVRDPMVPGGGRPSRSAASTADVTGGDDSFSLEAADGVLIVRQEAR